MIQKTIILFSVSLILILFSSSFGTAKTGKKRGTGMNLKLTSSAFQEGAMIPSKYTCDGDNVSPPLEWSGVPDTAKSLALICDDPDAPVGIWVHWVYYNIPARTRMLKEGIQRARILEDGSMQGVNDSRKTGYDGPCPPGGTHRYYFKLYALDSSIKLGPDAVKADLVKAMNGHILAEGQLMGRYQRK